MGKSDRIGGDVLISLYSGTPGSGKTFHVSQKIYYGLRAKKNYICNFPVNLDYIKGRKRKIGRFDYVKTSEINPEYLLEYAKKHHSFKKESETTIVIDECGIIFNPRGWDNKSRMAWIEFFSLHRHYGFDVILISQTDRMIDRQIRGFVEYEHRHRKINNYKIWGRILGLLCGGTLFVDVIVWYGLREKTGSEFIRYSRKVAKIYDTFMLME